MSNVEYKCPHTAKTIIDGEEVEVRDCGMRHFGLPGGTRHKCRIHDIEYVQTEVTNAPDFLNIDEDGKTKSKDILLPDKTRAHGGDGSIGQAAELPADAQQLILRGVYKRMTGDDPDLRWGGARLQDEIDDYVASLNPPEPDSESVITGEGNDPGQAEVGEGEDESEPEIPEGYELIQPGTIVDAIPN